MEQFIQAKKHKKRVLGEKLAKGQITVQEAVKENPELLFGYKRLKADVEAYHRDVAELKEDCKDTIPNTWDEIMPIVDGKQKHYWVWSREPNRGKTTWLKEMASKYRCTWYSY